MPAQKGRKGAKLGRYESLYSYRYRVPSAVHVSMNSSKVVQSLTLLGHAIHSPSLKGTPVEHSILWAEDRVQTIWKICANWKFQIELQCPCCNDHWFIPLLWVNCIFWLRKLFVSVRKLITCIKSLKVTFGAPNFASYSLYTHSMFSSTILLTEEFIFLLLILKEYYIPDSRISFVDLLINS